jgi:hypothetical protein
MPSPSPVAIPTDTNNYIEMNNIEAYVRNALTFKELSPGAEAQINQLKASGNLSVRELTLLAILRDAIQDGCIRRVEVSKCSQSVC